jgi:hypothetical protein
MDIGQYMLQDYICPNCSYILPKLNIPESKKIKIDTVFSKSFGYPCSFLITCPNCLKITDSNEWETINTLGEKINRK